MTKRIDLNADMGEFANEAEAETELALMALVSSCSIACGGHTGDPASMRRTALLAEINEVRIGAHPAYPDREGFGRRTIEMSLDDLEISIRSQINALRMVLNDLKVPLAHVKPHGALYNDAARDADLAACVVRAAGEAATLIGPPGSALEAAATAGGLGFIAEGFVDRRYRADGSLAPRSEPGAVIADIDARTAQALILAEGRALDTDEGPLHLAVQTLCIHSDSPGAVETARAVRDALTEHGFDIEAVAGGA